LQVSASGLAATATRTFSVTGTSTGVSATKLMVMSEPPSTVAAGSGFGLTVAAVTSSGSVDPLYNGPVTVSLAANPSGGALGGTMTVTASNGLATFSALSLSKGGNGYTLALSGSGVSSITTSSISVTSPLRIVGETVLTAGTGRRKHVTGYQLIFSGALNSTNAQNAANYTLTEKVIQGRKTINRAVKLNAVYDPTGHTVSLLFTSQHQFLKGGSLVVNASSPTGIIDSSGSLIDGDNNGTSGGNAGFVISARGKALTPTS